jgi:hypothetical protein
MAFKPAKTDDSGAIVRSQDMMGVGNVDAMSYAELVGLVDTGAVTHIQDIDDVITIDKDDLVGHAMVITSWELKLTSDYGAPYVVVKVATADGRHAVFADGSTGIRDQLERYGHTGPILVPKGLRVSNYQWTDPADGIAKPAKTFYIDNAA